MLRVHLGLVVPGPPGRVLLRAGDRVTIYEEGRCLVFDDTFEHEAWNDSDVPRAVLILDIWSPHVSAAERELVSKVTADVGEFYGTGSYHEGGS